MNQYQRKGPDASTRVLLSSVSEHVRAGDSLLDVGSGVGVIPFELFPRGIARATLVDASPAYLDAARNEAERRQLTDRVRRIAGDVVRLGRDVDRADVVTMHRVICCYPEWTALLDSTTALSLRLLALSYPRDRWYVRAFVRLDNFRRRVFRNAFRTFVHTPAAMEARIIGAGFNRIVRRHTATWCVDVYARRHVA